MSNEKKGKAMPLKSLLDQSFQLFCSGSVEYLYHDISPTMRVDFFKDDTDPNDCEIDPRTLSLNPNIPKEDGVKEDETGIIEGFVYINASIQCHFGPLHLRKRASRSPLTLRSDNGHQLSFTFIRDRYLKMTLSWEMVFTHMADRPWRLPPTAPEVFQFVGILSDPE